MAKLVLGDQESDLSPEAHAVKEFEKQLQYDFLHTKEENVNEPEDDQDESESDTEQVEGEHEVAEVQPEEPVMPKRRGRPPGSKNRPAETLEVPPPKRRGRPPGSKNKVKAAAPVEAPTAPPKRRGRPPKASAPVAPPFKIGPAPVPATPADPTLQVFESISKISNREDAATCMRLLNWFADHLANR